MSSPLSTLKRYGKLPLPGPMRKINLPVTPEEERETNALLEEVTASVLKSLLNKDQRRSLPNVDLGSASFSSQRQMSDRELLSLMAGRLTNAEVRLKLQKEELIAKDKKILYLERKIRQLEDLCGKSRDEIIAGLTQQCEDLRSQIREMEDFLYDYGLVWVGESKDKQNKGRDTKNNASVSNSSSCISEENISQPSSKIDYDVIIANIKELNILAGEGVAKVESTKDGARLKYTEPAKLTIYKNGIVFLNGPFRPLSDPATRRCLYDIMEGFFPSELQSTYPEGIPLEVVDNRNMDYITYPPTAFPGTGQLLSGADNSSSVSSQQTPETSHRGQYMTQPHEPRLTVDQFIKKLPSCVIKDGKKLEVRKSVEALLRSPPKPRQLTIIETLVEREKQTLTQTPMQLGVSNDIANIRVKSETGDCTYLLKMNYLDTVGDLRTYIDTHRPSASPPYKILSTFPRRVLDDLEATIEECGLIPTATLVLEAAPYE